jgi:hypothetical protein
VSPLVPPRVSPLYLNKGLRTRRGATIRSTVSWLFPLTRSSCRRKNTKEDRGRKKKELKDGERGNRRKEDRGRTEGERGEC